MKFHTSASVCSVLALVLFASAASSPGISLNDNEYGHVETLDALYQQAQKTVLANLDADEAAARQRGETPTCTRGKSSIRKEFGSMEKEDRKANTPAVNASGVRSRFDDFIVTHINLAPYVHLSGTFLGWHRYYLQVYEQALRTECFYTGPIPSWNWPQYASAPQDAPMFNGDAYSMGGNGEFIPDRGMLALQPPIASMGNHTTYMPTQLGGGCVKSRRFSNMTVNLGPISFPNATTGQEGGLAYNPRCLKRDIGPWATQKFANYAAVLEVTQTTNIADFQETVQGTKGIAFPLGIHAGGHFTISGDPGGDFWVSPGDLAFYLHHGQVDRLWALWQALDPQTRQNQLAGTNTLLNDPPSANTTLEDEMNVMWAGRPGETVKVGDIMSTTKGVLCYIYM